METHHVISIQLRDAKTSDRLSVSFEIDGKPATEADVRALIARKKADPTGIKLTAETKIVKA